MPEPLTPPIVASSAYRFADTAETLRALAGEGHMYSRWSNPTVEAVEQRLAALTGGERALCFGSGMAAISSTLICALAERPRLLCAEAVYGETRRLVKELLPRLGVEVTWLPPEDLPAAIEAAGEAGVVWVESPSNPLVRLVEIEAAAAAARRVGARLIVDATFASPVVLRPLALGADVEVHSASKWLGGHHDLLAGAVAGEASFMARLEGTRRMLGGILDPFPAFLLHRGLETLEVRVQRAGATARALADWLAEQPGVRAVHHPSRGDDPAARTLLGPPGILAFEVEGGLAAATRAIDALATIARAGSLGGTRTTASLPRATSHAKLSDAERERLGITDGVLRLSVGLEPLEPLQEDLARALAAPG